MKPHEVPIDHTAAARYEATRTLASKYVKEYRLDDHAWQWAVWFVYNGQQCGTRCPYWPEECFVGSDTCCECEGFEAIQIVSAHTGRVYCKNKRAEVLPLPECQFFPWGSDRLHTHTPTMLPPEPCPW